MLGVWQPVQPIRLKTAEPAVTVALIGPRGGGARKLMKLLKLMTAVPSSFSSGSGLQRSLYAQSPLGHDSSGNSGFVMPISLTYASPENWNNVGTCAFQPNLPITI